MNYLLDTHVVLWWLTTPERIAPKANQIICDKSNDIWVSSASCWQMGIKKGIGRLTLPQNILEALTQQGFKLLPISPEAGLGVADLPAIHADPFDRLLIMQAKLHDLILITHDAKIAEYPVMTLRA